MPKKQKMSFGCKEILSANNTDAAPGANMENEAV